MPHSEAMSFSKLASFALSRGMAANLCTLACRAHGKAFSKLTAKLLSADTPHMSYV